MSLDKVLVKDVALSSDANVKAVLIGAYDELGVGNIWGGRSYKETLNLLGADGEVLWAGTFAATQRNLYTDKLILIMEMSLDSGLML